MDDIELTVAALQACGYRVHVKERNGTRWVTAVKGLEVQYKHWHPLTNIGQAMQLFMDAPQRMTLMCSAQWAWIEGYPESYTGRCAEGLINAQCRAIINACATLQPVK